MAVVPEPYEWDMIPEMSGTLVYERKNELWWGLFFLFFCFIKTIPDWSVLVKITACCFLPHAVIDNILMLRF